MSFKAHLEDNTAGGNMVDNKVLAAGEAADTLVVEVQAEEKDNKDHRRLSNSKVAEDKEVEVEVSELVILQFLVVAKRNTWLVVVSLDID